MRGQDAAGEAEHGVPVVGQGDRPGVARDELPTGGQLELAHLLAHGRLAQLQLFGGPGEAQRLGDGDEGAQQRGVEHERPPLIEKTNGTYSHDSTIE